MRGESPHVSDVFRTLNLIYRATVDPLNNFHLDLFQEIIVKTYDQNQ